MEDWGANMEELMCAWYPYDCDKCPTACDASGEKSARGFQFNTYACWLDTELPGCHEIICNAYPGYPACNIWTKQQKLKKLEMLLKKLI